MHGGAICRARVCAEAVGQWEAPSSRAQTCTVRLQLLDEAAAGNELMHEPRRSAGSVWTARVLAGNRAWRRTRDEPNQICPFGDARRRRRAAVASGATGRRGGHGGRGDGSVLAMPTRGAGGGDGRGAGAPGAGPGDWGSLGPSAPRLDAPHNARLLLACPPMIDSPPPTQALNSYNVAQLQYALHDGKSPRIESLTDVHVLDYLSPSASPALLSVTPLSPSRLPASELDYDSRRMSSSTASDSSLQSRPDHRALSRSPPRPADAWPHTPSPQPDDRRPAEPADPSRVQLPSLASAFTDRHDARRASLPTLFDPRHRPPPGAAGLAGYQFPPDASDDRRG
ncbi:hypothetical protein WOLCODRAFT_150388, partial [Wolfiporia cocos MD-104 SS10]